MEIWVRLENVPDEEAFRLHVGYAATVSDTLVSAHGLFFGGDNVSQNSGARGKRPAPLADRGSKRTKETSAIKPQNLSLTLNGVALSNRETLRTAVATVLEDDFFDISRLTFVLTRKTAMQKLLSAAATTSTSVDPNSGDNSNQRIGNSGGETPRGYGGSNTPTSARSRARANMSSPKMASGLRTPQTVLSGTGTPQELRSGTSTPRRTGTTTPQRATPTSSRMERTATRTPIRVTDSHFPQPGPNAKTLECQFKPKWGSELCANCGVHKRYHTQFDVPVVEKQRRIVTRGRRHVDVTMEDIITGEERQSWNRRAVIELQNESAKAELALQSAKPVHALWRGNQSASRMMSPKGTRCDGHRREHKACDNFEPLWGNNDVCGKCYRYEDEHPIPDHIIEKMRKKQAARAKALKRKKMIEAIRSLPWEHILSFCEVNELFNIAGTSRGLLSITRPILEATMQLVLDFERPPIWHELEEDAVHLAECLSPYGDNHVILGQVIQTVLRLPTGDLSNLDNFTYRIDLVKQLAVVDAVSLDDQVVAEMAQVAELGFGEGHDLWPIVVFLDGLAQQYSFKRRAGEYLRRDKIPILP